MSPPLRVLAHLYRPLFDKPETNAIVLALQPDWFDLIAAGDKAFEFRSFVPVKALGLQHLRAGELLTATARGGSPFPLFVLCVAPGSGALLGALSVSSICAATAAATGLFDDKLNELGRSPGRTRAWRIASIFAVCAGCPITMTAAQCYRHATSEELHTARAWLPRAPTFTYSQ
jgi:hypothetical protein